MRIEISKGIKDQQLIMKAMNLVQSVEQGLLRPKTLTCNKARVINVGLRYRCVQLKNTEKWILISHESYNKKYAMRG